jgi:uncharacterized integral membrane protein
MVRIVVSVVLLVALAILVSLNLGVTAAVNLFGARVQGVSVVTIALLSFAVGVVYALFLSIAQSMHRRKRKALDARHKEVTERERAVTAREEEAKRTAEKPGSAEGAAEGTDRPTVWQGVARFLGGGKDKDSKGT